MTYPNADKKVLKKLNEAQKMFQLKTQFIRASKKFHFEIRVVALLVYVYENVPQNVQH
jgi:hypothetical protein